MKTMAMRREILAQAEPSQSAQSAAGNGIVPRFTTSILFAGSNEVGIAHGLETYRLRLTRQNRLILTK